jgi:hypothetical protein
VDFRSLPKIGIGLLKTAYYEHDIKRSRFIVGHDLDAAKFLILCQLVVGLLNTINGHRLCVGRRTHSGEQRDAPLGDESRQ